MGRWVISKTVWYVMIQYSSRDSIRHLSSQSLPWNPGSCRPGPRSMGLGRLVSASRLQSQFDAMPHNRLISYRPGGDEEWWPGWC